MSVICPSVTPSTIDPHEYRVQLEKVAAFAPRVQLDFMDGQFAPTQCMNVAQAWWPEGIIADIHLMYQQPRQYLETLIALKPSLVILHAEAEGDIAAMLGYLQKGGVKAGLALLQQSQPEHYADMIQAVDHVLLFSGDLGKFGGQADLGLLAKVSAIRTIKPEVEIGWDGGVSLANVRQLADGGVDVVNVGGAIQRASNPQEVYDTMVKSISN